MYGADKIISHLDMLLGMAHKQTFTEGDLEDRGETWVRMKGAPILNATLRAVLRHRFLYMPRTSEVSGVWQISKLEPNGKDHISVHLKLVGFE